MNDLIWKIKLLPKTELIIIIVIFDVIIAVISWYTVEAISSFLSG